MGLEFELITKPAFERNVKRKLCRAGSSDIGRAWQEFEENGYMMILDASKLGRR